MELSLVLPSLLLMFYNLWLLFYGAEYPSVVVQSPAVQSIVSLTNLLTGQLFKCFKSL